MKMFYTLCYQQETVWGYKHGANGYLYLLTTWPVSTIIGGRSFANQHSLKEFKNAHLIHISTSTKN